MELALAVSKSAARQPLTAAANANATPAPRPSLAPYGLFRHDQNQVKATTQRYSIQVVRTSTCPGVESTSQPPSTHSNSHRTGLQHKDAPTQLLRQIFTLPVLRITRHSCCPLSCCMQGSSSSAESAQSQASCRPTHMPMPMPTSHSDPHKPMADTVCSGARQAKTPSSSNSNQTPAHQLTRKVAAPDP